MTKEVNRIYEVSWSDLVSRYCLDRKTDCDAASDNGKIKQ